MNLDQQVTSLEISKKLKELGVEQESEFVWIDRNLSTTETNEQNIIILWKDVLSEWEPKCEIICSAFTVAELGEMLPEYCRSRKQCEEYACDYNTTAYISDETEADARGAMLIYLLENKLKTK